MTKIYNSELEISLRTLIVLAKNHPLQLTADRITVIDFIITHGKEFGISDIDLNGNGLFKYAEIVPLRKLTHTAIKELVLRDLIIPSYSNEGFQYSIAEKGLDFTNSLSTTYARVYASLVEKAVQIVANKSEEDIMNFVTSKALKLTEVRIQIE